MDLSLTDMHVQGRDDTTPLGFCIGPYASQLDQRDALSASGD